MTLKFRLRLVAASTAFAFISAHAVDGPTAPYNEAVQIVNGKRVVDVAPLLPQYKASISSFTKPGTRGETTRFAVETPQGLMDCNYTPFYHPDACSPSDFGKVVRDRAWTVKMHGAWFICIGRAKPIQCIALDNSGRSLRTPLAPYSE